jgi:hypothetical protein
MISTSLSQKHLGAVQGGNLFRILEYLITDTDPHHCLWVTLVFALGHYPLKIGAVLNNNIEMKSLLRKETLPQGKKEEKGGGWKKEGSISGLGNFR